MSDPQPLPAFEHLNAAVQRLESLAFAWPASAPRPSPPLTPPPVTTLPNFPSLVGPWLSPHHRPTPAPDVVPLLAQPPHARDGHEQAGGRHDVSSPQETDHHEEATDAEHAHAPQPPRAFACPVEGCGKSFDARSGLNRHTRTHTGKKPFKCTYPGCSAAFAESGNLSRHVRVHTNEKPYVCSWCRKAFANSSHLRRHELIHTGEKPFTCNHCGRSFRQSGLVKRHKCARR